MIEISAVRRKIVVQLINFGAPKNEQFKGNQLITCIVRKRIYYICCMSVLLISKMALGQEKRLTGKVIDGESYETLPMVNVYFKGTTVGTMTDINGQFTLTNFPDKDTLIFSSVGFIQWELLVKDLKSPCEIRLKPEQINIGEVSVRPDDSRIRWIIKQVVDHKEENNPDKHHKLFYEKYTKWEYRINNVDSALMYSKPFKEHVSLFKKGPDGRPFLPIYLSEQIVHNEYQTEPLKQKSTVVADNTSGLGMLGDMEVGGYATGLDMPYNFYNNYLKIFEESFVSPAASNGWFYYKYYLEDSVVIDDVKHFKVLFTPKRKHDKVFRGHMLIESKHFSLVNVDAVLSSKSNVNFLKDMQVSIGYQMLDGRWPFYKDQNVKAWFDYLPFEIPGQKKKKNRMELAFKQYTSFSDVEVNPKEEITLSTRSVNYESLKMLGAYDRDSTYWGKARHMPLTHADLAIYARLDSINEIPVINTFDRLARMMMTGYYDVGKVELGPFMNYVQANKIEGWRFFLGGRTSKEISDKWMVWGGLGYGTRTEQVYGSLGGGYKIPSTKRKVFKLFYDDHYVRMGENRKILYLYENMLSPSENNLVSAFFTRDTFDELHRQKNVNFSYENEWRTGFSTTFNLEYRKQFSPEYYPFLYNGKPVDHISVYEAGLDMRFSFKEKIIDDEFMRLYLSTDYPIIHFSAIAGRATFENQEHNYYKLHSTIKHRVNMGQTWFRYAVEGGMILGKVPFTLLEMPRGNETYGYFSYDFNMIDYLEFAHDRYAHLYLDYHLNGFVFNRMPLLKSLGLREVFSAKAMVGSLSDKQYETISMPASVRSLDGPYLEVGAGLENILRMFRIEGIWRVKPKSITGAPNFGVRVKFELKL
jgi:hypothetical protein